MSGLLSQQFTTRPALLFTHFTDAPTRKPGILPYTHPPSEACERPDLRHQGVLMQRNQGVHTPRSPGSPNFPLAAFLAPAYSRVPLDAPHDSIPHLTRTVPCKSAF